MLAVITFWQLAGATPTSVFSSVMVFPVEVFITYKLMVACLNEGSSRNFVKAALNCSSDFWANEKQEEKIKMKRSNFFNTLNFKLLK